MQGRSVAEALGIAGGLIIVLAGGVQIIVDVAGAAQSMSAGPLRTQLATELIAILLGGLIVFFSRPRLVWWRSRLYLNGILVGLLGAVTWYAVPMNILIVVGSILAIVAGVIFVAVGAASGRSARRWLR